MAGILAEIEKMTGGLFAVLDDIAILFDDIAVMSKVAAKKTAGILGDDLAVNAEKATGFRASRELPVLWAITRGSFFNKLIILPLAFLLSAYAPMLIVPVLLVGGAYLCFEGAEKIFHTLFHKKTGTPAAQIISDTKELLNIEKVKVQSAVRTDFILSIEIIVIALGTVMEKPLLLQIVVVSFVAILATVGVYGLVALLVRMDDMGFYLIERAGSREDLLARGIARTGSLMVASLPIIIRALGIIGTAAMLLVGGGIFTHNLDILHHFLEIIPSLLRDMIIGMALGSLLLGVQLLVRKLMPAGQGK